MRPQKTNYRVTEVRMQHFPDDQTLMPYLVVMYERAPGQELQHVVYPAILNWGPVDPHGVIDKIRVQLAIIKLRGNPHEMERWQKMLDWISKHGRTQANAVR